MILNFSFDTSVGSAPIGFTATLNSVASFFQNLFSDPVTINIAVGYGEVANQPMSSGALGQSSTRLSSFSYSQIKSALTADAKSATDSNSVASLPVSDPTGGHYWVATAEAKALGLLSSNTLDGSIGFSSTAAFDYDLSNGVTGGQYDFFGVVVHEVSEVLGRQLLTGASIGSTTNSYEPMDLFHFASPGVRTFLGTQAGYFSSDNGVTNLDNFNTNPGGDFGDWANSAGNDAAKAFSSSGVVNAFTQADIQVMDALGWDLSSDTTAPTLAATSPADNSTTVAVGSNLVLTFSENVKAGSGNLVIHKASDGSVAASIAISDSSQVSISGSTVTINPASDLAGGTHYYVTMASGVVLDLAGNAYSGISSNTAFDFTTATMTAIESIGATTLAQSGNQFYLLDSGGAGPILKYQGIDALANRWSGWAPIGAEKTATGYEVAWKGPGPVYEVWNTDNAGNFISMPVADVPGSDPGLQSAETVFQQDLNGDGHIGTGTSSITIEAIGATTLSQSGNQFSLLDSSGGAGPILKYQGVDALANRWAGWAPIGAEKTATGYEVAWKGPGPIYEVWNTDSAGNFTSMPVADVPGSNAALQSAETSFQQDLNGDGHIGTGTGGAGTTIEAFGATTLSQSGNQFSLLDSSGAGPILKYQGVDALANRWAGWAPIGAEKTATGYEVAWKGPGPIYEVWVTDSNGNFTSMPVAEVPGSDPNLQSAETLFQQDLNGDGHIGTGASGITIEAIGATTLSQSGNQFSLLDSSGAGPILKYQGVDALANRWAGWAPLGAEKTATGYEVAWKGPGPIYEVWVTDSAGNFTSMPVAEVPGSDPNLQSAETLFQQDLNGDGHIGLLGAQMAGNDLTHDVLL